VPDWNPNRWRALPIILIAPFMSLFDVFVVNVAAPSISTDLHASAAMLELIVAGYSFTYAAGLVTGGRLGDRIGRKQLFLGGMALFTLASAWCGIAPSSTWLVAGRLVQGAGAAAMVPQVLALITVSFPPEERPRAFSLFGVTIGVGSVAGQVLGGVLLDLNIGGLGWRPIFLVNVPIGIAAILGARKFLGESRSAHPEKLDPIGLATLTAGLGLVLVPLVLGRDEGWPTWTWVALAAGAVAIGVFATWEARLARSGGNPIVPPAILRSRQVTAGLAANLGFFVFFGSFLLAMTVFLQEGQHRSPLDAGLTFAPLGVAFALSSLAARRLVAVYGPRVLTAGVLVSLTSLGCLTLLVGSRGAGVSSSELIPLLTAIGVGNGLALPSLVASVLATAPPDSSGAISGVLTTTQQFSSALGVAAIGGVFFSRLASAGPAAGLHAAMALELIALAVAAVATVFLPRTPAGVNVMPAPAARRDSAGSVPPEPPAVRAAATAVGSRVVPEPAAQSERAIRSGA
jgi:EmrB/QacA subfamily drug resistance transporter